MIQFHDVVAQYQAQKDEIDQAILRVMQHGQFIMGPEVEQLEVELAKFVGSPSCISVSSGTHSLEIALRALGVGPGDEVITTPFTWISSAEVILLVGAKPVFVDIEDDSYNISVTQVAEAITAKTRAVIAVDLFGQMADYAGLRAVCGDRGIALIEDAAQSFGAQQSGIPSCSATEIGSTSFFPTKPLGCFGDGGALFTNDFDLAQKFRAIRSHGGLVRHHHTEVGLNGRLDTLQAAILLVKLQSFTHEVKKRQQLAARYDELFGGKVSTPSTKPGNTHVYAQYTIRVKKRDDLIAKLKENGLPSAVFYPKCLHEQPVFSSLGYERGCFPIAETAAQHVLSLPIHAYLDSSTQDRIAEVVLDHAS